MSSRFASKSSLEVIEYFWMVFGRVVLFFFLFSAVDMMTINKIKLTTTKLTINKWTNQSSNNKTIQKLKKRERARDKETNLMLWINTRMIMFKPKNENILRPRWDSNPQSSDSKSDALSVGPRGHVSNWHKGSSYIKKVIGNC